MLEGNNPLKKKVPYIFITNGGGRSETDRARYLSKDFNVEVSASGDSTGTMTTISMHRRCHPIRSFRRIRCSSRWQNALAICRCS